MPLRYANRWHTCRKSDIAFRILCFDKRGISAHRGKLKLCIAGVSRIKRNTIQVPALEVLFITDKIAIKIIGVSIFVIVVKDHFKLTDLVCRFVFSAVKPENKEKFAFLQKICYNELKLHNQKGIIFLNIFINRILLLQ